MLRRPLFIASALLPALTMLACGALMGGLNDGASGHPIAPPHQGDPLPSGGKDLLAYGGDILAYLVAYILGSVGKGVVRSKLRAKEDAAA